MRCRVQVRFVILVALATGCFTAPAADLIKSGTAALNRGDLTKAGACFSEAAQAAAVQNHPVDEGVARKWLGLALARLGDKRFEEAMDQLRKAELLLTPELGKGDKNAAEQLGYVLFNMAEMLRIRAENRLREQRSIGLGQGTFFSMLNEFVIPAEQAIVKARGIYPANRASELDLEQAELQLLLAGLSASFLPAGNALESYEKAATSYQVIIEKSHTGSEEIKPDTLLTAMIRKCECLKEQASLTQDMARRKRLLDEAIAVVKPYSAVRCEHVELMAYAAYRYGVAQMDALQDEIPPESFSMIEKPLLLAAGCVEEMRSVVNPGVSFDSSRSFFSPRTHGYEALVRFYGRSRQPEKMLWAVERMKARAFRDLFYQTGAPDIDVEKLRLRLQAEDAALIEYFYDADRTWALLVLPKEGVSARELTISGQDLNAKIRQVMAGFADQACVIRLVRTRAVPLQMACAFKSASELYALLLAPVTNSLARARVKRLYIVPHHAMNYLSFNALVTALGQPDVLESHFYVEDGLPLTVLPSAATLLDIPQEKIGGKSIVMARSDFTSRRPTYPCNLAGTLKEAKMAATILSADLWVEGEATEARLRSATGSHHVLYFATHGVLDSMNPLNSAVLLAASADASDAASDGRLTVEELINGLRGKLASDVVILSACMTNRGEENPLPGDDLSGMARAFLVAGARSVLATQWNASDTTFPPIMEHFLKTWTAEGLPKDVAMQRALRWFLGQSDIGIWRHPLFWAPVVLVGSAE